jgi:hypothetical protein
VETEIAATRNRPRLLAALATGAGLCLALASTPVGAEVSPFDGYSGPGGAYQVHVELAPYLWLPANSTTFTLGRGAAFVKGGDNLSISSGVPSVSNLVSSLTGAFLGYGLVRYGPYSAELDIDYVGAKTSIAAPTGPLGVSRSLTANVSFTRVAPGIGYEVYNGQLGGVPVTVDGRVGFSWMQANASLDLDDTGPLGRLRIDSISADSSFAQPWVGLRGDIYPWPRWRFELAALGQGFGVDGGVWGWGVTATGAWAATSWLNLIAGFSALNSERYFSSRAVVKSVAMTNYGPLIAFGFTF